jgi:hypothetical protein
MNLAMPALPSEVDIGAGLQDVCFVPMNGHSIASSVLRSGLFGQPRFPKTLNRQL